MSKYIDVDTFVLKVVQSGGGADFINKVTGLMLDTPSIYIVHCQECAFRGRIGCPRRNTATNKDNDFCSKGKREGE